MIMSKILGYAALSLLAGYTSLNADSSVFDAADFGQWQEVFSDACTGDWKEQWFCDGEIGTVETSTNGMQLTAGPQFGNDAHHMVLWTKASFAGDLKIDFEYTRLDTEMRGVNILYIQATGSGAGPYVKDIAEWNNLRRVPAMKMYFDHMNAVHISYAAFPVVNDDPENDYIRGRRYVPETGTGLAGTDYSPDYFPDGLFSAGVPHYISVIKKGQELFMRIKTPEQMYFCHMTNTNFPSVTEGRIGLRHMYTRSALYKNIRISAGK
jgi:hypothetical protein